MQIKLNYYYKVHNCLYDKKYLTYENWICFQKIYLKECVVRLMPYRSISGPGRVWVDLFPAVGTWTCMGCTCSSSIF